MKKTDDLTPRILTRRQACAYWGVSENTFRKMIALGIVPGGPISTPGLGRDLFDRLEQDAAIEAKRGKVA